MKSIKIFAAAGAISLLGMAGLSSCKTNNGPEGPGTYNGETVKTEFSIAIPEVGYGNNGGVLRMPSTTAQVNPNSGDPFRGMMNIFLIPYSTTEGSPASPKRGGSNITLGDIAASGGLNSQGAKVYTDVTIPIGTNSFLFYGEALTTYNGENPTDAEMHQYGMLTPKSITGAPSVITFDLQQINTKTPSDSQFDDKGLISYLNGIRASQDNQTTSVAWKDYASVSPALASIFTKFSTISAGSSKSIERALTDVVALLQAYKETGADTYGLVDAIYTKIKGESNADATLTITGTVAGNDLSVSLTLSSTHQGFPANLGLPDGAACLQYDATNGFSIKSTTNANGMPLNSETDNNNHGLTNYVYPASLYYFVNSKIRVSDQSKSSSYASMSDNWSTFLTNNYGATDSEVGFTTKSVAITDQIQYAVGRMDLQVGIVSSPLYYDDPQLAANTETGNKSITTEGIPVTAILIGGQKNVDYKFEPNGATAFTIYDNAVPASWNTGTPGKVPVGSLTTDKNYTLALESTKDEKVRIALELVNNLGDFYNDRGELIPNGAKFYLVGQLDPTDVTTTAPAHTGTASDKDNTDGKVFKQDFFTQVTLRLGNKCLKKAYNTIPDLRATKLELGLSVDLTWQQGMSFDVTL